MPEFDNCSLYIISHKTLVGWFKLWLIPPVLRLIRSHFTSRHLLLAVLAITIFAYHFLTTQCFAIEGMENVRWILMIVELWLHLYNIPHIIKTHGHVSAAKKAVWLTSVLFTGTANSPFLAPRIAITTGPISIKFTYFMPSIYATLQTKLERNRSSSSRDMCSWKLPYFLHPFLLLPSILH